MEIEAVPVVGENSKISELAEKAKIAESQNVNLMEPGQKAKKRGRPPKSETEKKQTPQVSSAAPSVNHSIPTKKIVEPFALLMSKAAGAYVGDKRAEMSVKELEDVSQALALVADKWMPTISKDYGPEMLLITTITSYGVRVVTLKKILEEERKAQLAFKPEAGKKPSESLAFPTDLKPADQGYISQNLGL